jgi:hypothetical protein
MPTLMSQQGKQQETVNYTVRGQYYVAVSNGAKCQLNADAESQLNADARCRS